MLGYFELNPVDGLDGYFTPLFVTGRRLPKLTLPLGLDWLKLRPENPREELEPRFTVVG